MREHIVSIANLLDRFSRQTRLREEELWARSEHSPEGSQVVCLVELLEVQLSSLKKQVHETETRTLTNQLKIESNRQYVDQHFHQMNETLTNLAHWMNIVEESTKNSNRMQEELTTITTEIAAVRKSQMALTNLMEGISTRLDIMPEMDLTEDESLDDKTKKVAKDWYTSGFGWSTNPMERLAMIPKVMDT